MATTYPRYSLYDKDGYYITDIRTNAVTSWTLPSRGVVGECTFSLSRYEPKNRNKYVGFGRYLLRRQLNMPDWIGVIYPPRSWPVGATSIRAYQAEKILAWRKTPMLKITGQAGSLFTQILNITNSPDMVTNEKPILPGQIWRADVQRDETLGNDALSHVWRIAQRAQNDFSVSYSFDDFGRLYLKGNWYTSAGIDTGMTLREGFNIELSDSALDENGELYNDYLGVNDANTPQTRLYSRAWRDVSIAENGLYQKTIAYSGIKAQSTLDNNLLSELYHTSGAKRLMDISVLLDLGNTAENIDVGNLWAVEYNDIGYRLDGFGTKETVKILGFEVDDTNYKKARLITEVQNQ